MTGFPAFRIVCRRGELALYMVIEWKRQYL